MIRVYTETDNGKHYVRQVSFGVSLPEAARIKAGLTERVMADGQSAENIIGKVVSDSTTAAAVVEQTQTPAEISAAKVSERRALVKRWLRVEVDGGNIMVWNAIGARESGINWQRFNERVANTWAWIFMIAKAASIDANLSDDDKWAIIKREIDFTVEGWYLAHLTINATPHLGWTPVRDTIDTVFYITATTATPGGQRGWANPTSPISMNAASHYDFTRFMLTN